MKISKKFVKLLVTFTLAVLALMPITIWAANQLSNPGLEADDPYIKYGTYNGPGNIEWDLQVADGWERFEIDSPNRLRYFTASDWAKFNNSPVIEKRDGIEAQVWWSSKKNDNGIYQQVFSRTIGETYGFQAGILQVFEETNRTDPATGNMLRSVGIDPYGGTDPEASTVIWGPEEPTATYFDSNTNQKYTWFYPGVGATAMSTTVTVFARVQIEKDAQTPHSNQVWIDDTFFDIAPTTELTLAVNSPTELMASWSGTPLSGFKLFAYEAQYRKASETTWTDLQIFTVQVLPSTNAAVNIPVEAGESYVVRARTWHEQEGGDAHEVPGPWMEKSITVGGLIGGNVLDNQGFPFSNVAVSVSGTATSTTSTAGGTYTLATGSGTFPLTATHTSGWASLEPISVTAVTSSTTPLTFTLRPPDDFIINGGLENAFTGWGQTFTQSGFINQDQRSGTYSLQVSSSGSLSQTGAITNMKQPTLSFWHKVEGGDGDDTMVVHIAGSDTSATRSPNTILLPTTEPLTITQATNGWQHLSLPLAISDTAAISGNLTVEFTIDQVGPISTTFYLDEVTFGGSRGLTRLYLPFIVKE